MDNSATQATLDTGHRANKITKKNTVKKGNNILHGRPQTIGGEFRYSRSLSSFCFLWECIFKYERTVDMQHKGEKNIEHT